MTAQDGRLVAKAANELVDQARLPDPGRAEDADQVAAALGGRPFEQPQQQLLLALPADEIVPPARLDAQARQVQLAWAP